MSEQPTCVHPFFQPCADHDNLQTAYLLWKIAERVEVRESGCWEWTGSKNSNGYGHFSWKIGNKTKTISIHRFVFQLCVGDPCNRCVLHTCDNPICCNPAHLWAGSLEDNNRDMRAKDRQVKGERVTGAKLAAEQVLEIRRLHALGYTKVWLAVRFSVSDTLIRQIVHRKIWKHV